MTLIIVSIFSKDKLKAIHSIFPSLTKFYCLHPTGFEPIILPGAVNVVGECTKKNPCNRCEGNCLSKDDCAPGLKCKNRVGYEAVPGESTLQIQFFCLSFLV